MTDENQPPELPQPMPPELIPEEAIQRWLQIPDGQPLTFSLTKIDVDHLFFALTGLAGSVDKLQAALVAYSNGQTDDANTALFEMRAAVNGAVTRTNRLMTTFMTKSQVIDG